MGEPNQLRFIISQLLSKIQTATLVEIVGSDASGIAPVGFVDVVPLVAQIDGQGKATKHATIYNVPYFRLQGGANAVVLDPQVGDIGICLFANRDISKVKATRKASVPGSYRKFSWSDGLYVGGVLNGTPSQFVFFEPGGITLKTAGTVTIDAPTTHLTGILTVDGDATAQGTSVHTHIHSGVTAGPSNTGMPV